MPPVSPQVTVPLTQLSLANLFFCFTQHPMILPTSVLLWAHPSLPFNLANSCSSFRIPLKSPSSELEYSSVLVWA